MEKYKVPTGHICTMTGERGKPLEFLSIGDYGKEKNLKADFMGLSNEINGVPHGNILPLEEKWVITISSQYGCSMGCSFCDVPKVGPGINATFKDLITQVKTAVGLHPEVVKTKRLNLHYARMGEPTWNRNVIESAYYLAGVLKGRGWGFHPVVSTMMPEKNSALLSFLIDWLRLKNNLIGEAGLQLSINTTDEDIRHRTMPHASSLEKTSRYMREAIKDVGRVDGRKITLNFALTDAPIDANYLDCLFPSNHFICKITPMHNTKACVKNGLITDNGYDHYYPYRDVEKRLKAVGYDVIVFIPSREEDESRITCGNAILAGG
jgi:23S rRNA (adenine2503-C2)-methyltransferase